MTDIRGDSSTVTNIAVGGSATSALEVLGDHDWFKIELIAGQTLTIAIRGITLEDSYLRVYSAGNILIDENDDDLGGDGLNSKLVFTAPSTGTYFLDVGAFDNDYIGTYELTVDVYTPPRNDFNGDGRSDILWRNSNGTIINWLADADGTFESNHAVATYALDPSFTVIGTGDFNGDGRFDMLLRNSNGTVTDWLGQANGGFVSNHVAATYSLGTNWTLAGTGDFNGDGRDDIMWRNEVGAMSQWLGQTNGGFAWNPNAAYQLPTNWQAAATGDFNGDGRDDIMWRNEVGALSEWLGQANGTFVYNGNAAYQLGTNWTLAASADFNGDGRDDILWRNEVGAMSQWLANADGTFAYNDNAAYQLPTNWALATVGDFNGDGRDDILWRNEVGAMAEWLANGDATFAYNPNAAYQLGTAWQVQDPGI